MNIVLNQIDTEMATRTLTPLVLVRIQVPQPNISSTYVSEITDFAEHSAYAGRTKTGTVDSYPLIRSRRW